jgi:hypothetical protein
MVSTVFLRMVTNVWNRTLVTVVKTPAAGSGDREIE